jgi:hypothetical protein
LEAHTITATFQENGSCVVRTDAIYAMYGGEEAEERFCSVAKPISKPPRRLQL